MIRRRAQNASSGTKQSLDDNEMKSIDKNDFPDRLRRRCLVSNSFVAMGVMAFVLIAIQTASYLDSISTIDPVHKPNNKIDVSESSTIGTIKHHGRESKESFAVSTSTLTISDIPFIRYEPELFKKLKAHIDHAISIGDEENHNNVNNTIGQYLLDFGIIGFPKCGTTTMMKWLNMHDHIAVIDFEITALQNNHPARILNYIIRDLPEGRYRRGYKSPGDAENGRARNKLGIHYGKTKLLVGLRHPVLWYESFYNHRVQNGYEMPDLMETIHKRNGTVNRNRIRNECHAEWKGVCFSRASFHRSLAKWGKTPLLFLPPEEVADGTDSRFNYTNYKKDDEFALFTEAHQKLLKKEMGAIDISPNPMFLYEVSQLRMPNAIVDDNERDKEADESYNDFVLSLQAFLGVPQNVSAMPAMIRESPGKKEGINATEQLRRDRLKIDLCDDKYEIPRQWLLEIGSNVHVWIENYFMKSPHNVFAGGISGSAASSQFLKTIRSYGTDPCLERKRQKHK
eukprot:CAMPEP_0172363706 /NCGR_PEP_ID=MMETSP1060-20121228/6984_1 /TAXON_ID=37318 /ORGANISM="Pseudo-nitzschia pungens, Strain cf. cingulata" /LENGTH=510 /DNA_ID=CAMNT_0013086505 /DNA_START=159 /DNA_END=1691 /DNA_ORIENTATION=+